MDVTAPEQPASPTTSVSLEIDELSPVSCQKVKVEEDSPRLRDGGVFSRLGRSQEEPICLVSDSEDESLPSVRAIAEFVAAEQRRETSLLETAVAAPTNASPTTSSTSDMDDDLHEATRGPSASDTATRPTNQRRERSQSSGSIRRSVSVSTAASVPINLPVDTAIAAPVYEPGSTASSSVGSQSVATSKHSMGDIAKHSRDSTPAEKASSEVIEEGDQDADGSSDKDESSDGDNDDRGDDGDDGSDTAGDGSENGSGRGRRSDSEYSSEDDDRERKNGKHLRDDSDDDCCPSPKRRQIRRGRRVVGQGVL